MLSLKKIFFSLIFFKILVVSILSAQVTTILFKQKYFFFSEKNIKIFFSTPDGLENVPITSVENSIYYNFCYKPIGKWDFDEEDISSQLNNIFVFQNGENIKNSMIEPKLINNKIAYVIVSFLKKNFICSEPFQFKNKLDTTQFIKIPEKYWPIYREYKNYYDQGLQLYKERKFISSFEKLKPFMNENTLIAKLSFYGFAKNLLSKIVTEFINKYKCSCRMLSIKLAKTSKISSTEIIEIDSLTTPLLQANELLREYFIKENNPESEKELQDLVAQISKTQKECKENYLSNFANKTYSNYQFRLFIDIISQSLCDVRYITDLKKLDTLAISSKTNFSDINKLFSNRYNQIKKLGWEREFDVFLQIIHENINNNRYIFDDKFIDNMKRLSNDGSEQIPYFSIISAFNHLFVHNYKLFYEDISLAIQKCANLNLLYKLELLQSSYIATIIKSVPDTILASLEEGNKLEEKGEYNLAMEKYDTISKKLSDFAPPIFFLGRVYYKTQEYEQAEICFDKAIRQNPKYLLPWRYKIQILIQKGDLEKAKEIVGDALKANNIWYLYYLQASIFNELGEYGQALDISVEKCLKINKYNFDLYILLGDIFKQMHNLTKAENQYKKAGELEVNNPIYNERMKEIKNLITGHKTN